MNYFKLFIIILILFITINYFINKMNIETFICKMVNDLPTDYRVKYYMKDAYNNKIYIPKDNYSKTNFITNIDKNKSNGIKNDFIIFKSNLHTLKTIDNKQYKNYINDLKYILSLNKNNNNHFQIALGDINSKCNFKGTIAKSRLPDDKNIILLKLNYPRHWKEFKSVKNNDIPYNKKNNKIIWRGVTTGYNNKSINKRYILVDKYYNHKNKNIDVGFSSIVQNRNDFKKYLKKSLNMKQQLQSKFIISVEGNDVSSGLKWQLYSNSVVFMTKPKVCSWLMEDLLIPGVHYISLKDDYSDLEEKYNWALKNDKKCMEISKNATNYMKQFLNKNREDKITKLIMNKYFENIVFTN